jgi:hypothetical protein
MSQPTRIQMNVGQDRANKTQARTAKKLAALARKANRAGAKAFRIRPTCATRMAGTFKRTFGGTPPLILKIHRGALAGDRYAQNKGVFVDTNMVGQSHAERLQEWQLDMARHPSIAPQNLFKHISISRPAGHDLDLQIWQKVGRLLLDEIGAAGVQFVSYRHQDTKCDHIHLIFSRVKQDCSLVSDSNNYYRWREAIRRVEALLNMTPIHVVIDTPAVTSDRAVNALRRANRMGTRPNRIDPRILHQCAVSANGFESYQAGALAVGIEVKKSISNGKVTGVLYRQLGANEWLSGSAISRSVTLPAIEKQFAKNRKSGHGSHQKPQPRTIDRPRNE